jgi:hypothetical protein
VDFQQAVPDPAPGRGDARACEAWPYAARGHAGFGRGTHTIRLRRLCSSIGAASLVCPASSSLTCPLLHWDATLLGAQTEEAAVTGSGAGAGAGSSSRFLHYSPDPTAQRTGDAPSPELAEVLNRTCDEAAAAVSKTQVERNVCLTRALLQEKLDHIRGAVTMGA